MSAASLRGRVDAVVIGTSAGGVEALGEILPALPAGLRVPVLIVIHLPSERDSLLPQIFQPKCARPVREAEDKEPIAPGSIYFAPPDYHLLIDEGPQLSLSDDPAVNFSRPSIDVLFESAADTFGARLAAVLLTGASEDGALGLHAVQRAGGVTIVQDPADAQVPVMVAAALRLIDASYVLALGEIARLLATLDVEATA